jgi:hypothetical protein
MAQKSERLNAAHSLLARGIGMTEAVVSLSRQFGRKRCGGDGAGFELTIGAAADPAAKPLGW